MTSTFSLKTLIVDFYNGICASLAIHKAWPIFLKSYKVRYRTAQSFLFNGIIYLTSIMLVEYTIFPLIRHVIGTLSGEEAGWVGFFLEGITWIFYHIFWLLPLYVISLILNMTTVTEVAEDTFKVVGLPHDKSSSVSNLISDMLFESLFLAMCMAVAGGVDILVMLSPYISKLLLLFYPVSFFYWAWIYAFCAFNTKWKLQGVGIIRRVGSIESNMAFFAGFGTPLTALTYFYPNFFVNAVFYALFYPWLVIVACASCNDSSNPTLNPLLKEKNDENYVMMRVNRFPIFRLPQSIAQKLLTCLFKSKLEVKNDDKKIREKREEEWE
tara:strand:- start:14 stop:991 length:978 start_codon:yes stop_codon:yes gene_type:complete